MKKKQREKLERERNNKRKRKKERIERLKIQRELEKEEPVSGARTFFGAFSFLLFVGFGWYLITSHLDANYPEQALQEPYYSWIKNFSILYLIVGIVAMVGWIFTVSANLNDKRGDFWISIFSFTCIILLGIGLLFYFLVALIKFHVPILAFIYLGTVLTFIIIETILFSVKKITLKVVLYTAIGLTMMVLIFQIFSDTEEGLFLMKAKGGYLDKYGTKFFSGVLGIIGTYLIIGFYSLLLINLEPSKKSSERDEENLL